MKLLTCTALALLSCAALAADEPASPYAAELAAVEVDVQRADALVRAWEDDQPQRETRLVRVMYWTPADTEPAPDYRARLTRVMMFTQKYYADQMEAWGLGRRSINLELADDLLLNLRVVRGSKPFDAYDVRSGQEVRADCVKVLREEGIDPDDETLVIFCNLSRWDPEKRTMKQTSPYYASGTHRNGNAWQVDSPLLDPDLLGVKDQKLHDGQYGHISVGRYNSIFIGGVVHEVGHALGLPHCRQTPHQSDALGTALMGSGNRTMGEELRGEGKGSFLTLPHALRLRTHVQFSGSTKRMRDGARITWHDTQPTVDDDGKTIEVTGRVESTIPVYAVIAYADPEGGGNYDAHVAAAVPDPAGRFTLRIPAPAKNGPAELRLVACCVNGQATAYSSSRATPKFDYHVTDGKAEFPAAR